eukprot:TRINITY_DN8099_c0_g1_i10.p1 TRINITY_DN8099_c0_g1~~TRINITY_DN8099_c0_g1_i10.p1  ORF type:complete len:133 (-),score=26.88 TRINITY_DN8099_c0_g1_i10:205-603(-)
MKLPSASSLPCSSSPNQPARISSSTIREYFGEKEKYKKEKRTIGASKIEELSTDLISCTSDEVRATGINTISNQLLFTATCNNLFVFANYGLEEKGVQTEPSVREVKKNQRKRKRIKRREFVSSKALKEDNV